MGAARNYLHIPLSELIADTAARTPTPGGGSVAAIVGALAAALGRMAVNYTLGKSAYASHETRLRDVLAELRRSGDMFMQLAREDMAAYERYASSRKSDDVSAQQQALMTAATVPLEMAAVASAVLQRLDEIKTFANPHLLSDVQAAALLADATASAAALNVRTNLVMLANRDDANQITSQLNGLLDHCKRSRESVLDFRPPPAAAAIHS